MADRRENILNRLVAVCASVTGISGAARNTREIRGVLGPVAIIWDGAAVPREREKRVKFSSRETLDMRPDIRLIVRGDDGVAAGALLSTLFGRLAGAILSDEELRGYVGTSGDIKLDEFSVDEPDPDAKLFRASLGMTFTYPFHLSDFV